MAIYQPPETIDEVLEMEKLEYMEQQNPLRADELKDPHRVIKIELLGIIAAHQGPVCCNKIFRDYQEMNGYELDVHAYGFKNFSSMMRTFSDKFVCHSDGIRNTYTAKKTERSCHLQELIENQITNEEKRRREMRRSRSYSRSRRSNYGEGIFYAHNFSPIYTDDRSPEQRAADNLASFGRSLAQQDVRAGLNWGMSKSRVESSSDESTDSTDDEGGKAMRSKSMPPTRGTARKMAFDDPRADENDDLEDCTNPFNVQNNVRIRDVVIAHGEMDDTGRKGMAVMEVAQKYRKQHCLPLGGVPNLSEEKLMKKMSAVQTTEWTVERMEDGVAYVILPAETLKRAQEVGPGSPSAPNSAEKQKRMSPAAKRMFSFAVKEAMSVNGRQTGTREHVILERDRLSSVSPPNPYGEILADSDGDPRMVSSPPPPPEEAPEEAPKSRKSHGNTTEGFDRSAMLALSDNDVLDPKVGQLVASMRILRTQESRRSPSNSSLSSQSGSYRNGMRQANGPSSRLAPPKPSSNMWSARPSSVADKPTPGFGGGSAPSFGTFRSAPPPAVAAGKEDVNPSDVMEQSQSNLAAKLPQMSFASTKPATSVAPSFSSAFATAPPASDRPMFGTTSQPVPSFTTAAPLRAPVPTFGAPSSSPSVPSAFDGPTASANCEKPQTPKKLIEVIEPMKNQRGSELLGAAIQLIGRLRSGATVFMKEIEGSAVEDVVASNPDFFDIDEKDERIHLLHKDVNPLLLTVDGKELGELSGEKKKEEMETEKKKEELPKEIRNGMFSRPGPPSFARPSPPSFARPSEYAPAVAARPMESKSLSPLGAAPSFGTASRKMVEVIEEKQQPEIAKPAPVPYLTSPPVGMMVNRPPSSTSAASSYQSVTSRVPPSFGTKSPELQRPDSALSIRGVDFTKREVPTFARPVERAGSAMSGRTDRTGKTDERTNPMSAGPSSIGSSIEALDVYDKEDGEVMVHEKMVEEREEHLIGPYAFPAHRDIRRLCKESMLAFDSVCKGEIQMASMLSSFHPNRLVLTLCDGRPVDKLEAIMQMLRSAYVNQPPLREKVALGQFAVAINGECVVRVVVLRQWSDNEDMFECACLDVNAMLDAHRNDLYALLDQFDVTALRSCTFIARINGVPELTDRGHKAVRLIAKSEKDDDNMRVMQPFVFYGKDEATDDLVVDVAVVVAGDCVWLGEALPTFTNVSKEINAHMNPDIQHALVYAKVMQLGGAYDIVIENNTNKKNAVVGEDEEDAPTLRSDSFEKIRSIGENEKEEGELDSSHDSTTTERTMVDRHAAGDFVRDVKEEEELADEFVVVAPEAVGSIIDVERMIALIKLFNEKGEDVEVDVIKSMCRALILSTNKTLASLGERCALIANAEALAAIDMA